MLLFSYGKKLVISKNPGAIKTIASVSFTFILFISYDIIL